MPVTKLEMLFFAAGVAVGAAVGANFSRLKEKLEPDPRGGDGRCELSRQRFLRRGRQPSR